LVRGIFIKYRFTQVLLNMIIGDYCVITYLFYVFEEKLIFHLPQVLHFKKLCRDGPCSKLVGSSYLLKVDATMQPLRYDDDQTKRNYINERSDVNTNLAHCVSVGTHVRFGVDALDIHRILVKSFYHNIILNKKKQIRIIILLRFTTQCPRNRKFHFFF
jgi:hypothetical protein